MSRYTHTPMVARTLEIARVFVVCRPHKRAEVSGPFRVWLMLAMLCAAGVTASSGCQRTLFRSADSRTQFDTADQVRGRHVPLVEADVFGNPQPALRARLGQRD